MQVHHLPKIIIHVSALRKALAQRHEKWKLNTSEGSTNAILTSKLEATATYKCITSGYGIMAWTEVLSPKDLKH